MGNIVNCNIVTQIMSTPKWRNATKIWLNSQLRAVNIVWFKFSGSEVVSRILWTWRGAGQCRLLQKQWYLVFMCVCCVTLLEFIEIYCTVLGEMGTKKKMHAAMELLMSESVMLYLSCGYGHVAKILQSPECSGFTNWTRDVFVVIAEKSLVLSCWKFSDFVFEKYIHRSGWNVEFFTYHREFSTIWVSWN